MSSRLQVANNSCPTAMLFFLVSSESKENQTEARWSQQGKHPCGQHRMHARLPMLTTDQRDSCSNVSRSIKSVNFLLREMCMLPFRAWMVNSSCNVPGPCYCSRELGKVLDDRKEKKGNLRLFACALSYTCVLTPVKWANDLNFIRIADLWWSHRTQTRL